jgi:hypothetical protein
MNRRELLLSTVGSILATRPVARDRVSADLVAPTDDDTSPAFVVFTAPGPISQATANRMLEKFNTPGFWPWPDVKAVVMGDGLTMQVYDRKGRLINRPIPKRRRPVKT